MRRFLTTGVFLGLTIAVPALAADLATLPTIDVVSSDDTGVRLECAFPDLSMDEVSLGGEVYVSLTIPGGGIVGEVGAPALPTFSRLVAIPDHAGVRVSVVPLEVEEIRDVALAPVTSGRPGELAIDDAAYASDRFDDLADATLGEPALLRDLRVVNLTFQPVHYNPAEKTLRVVRRMQVQVDFTGEDLRNVALVPARPIPPSFDRIYRELVLNYSDAARDEAVAAGSYVVICRNDAGVISRLQPLLDWRRRMGYPVVLATTSETGTTTTAIKSYLQTAYNTWETPPEFIVLAGDADGSYPVPTWFENISGYSGEGDHPYTTLAGGDILADAHIGRLSFANYSDLELIVEKILTYETNPTLDDPGWYSRACLVGDPSSSGQSTITVNQWLKERLRDLHYTEIDTIWSSPFVSQMTLALNKGGTVFNYRGYLGMSGWSNALSEALTNRAKMPFAVVITCDTGSFAGATSRTEGLLRAGVPGTPAGAIAAIGTSTIGTHTRYNNCMDYGIQRGLVEEGLFQTGVALTRGKLEVYLNYFKTEPARAETWAHWNNLMGDPAVDIYNAYPTALNVTHPAQIAFGANALEIVVEDGFGPLAGVRVCADKDGETHAVGYTDANGYVELPLTNTSIGDLLITATGHDKYPYLATVPVAAEPAYVGYLASTIDDDAAGTSSGNGDGIVNPAETIELPVQVRNFGINPATNVSADLTTTDPYVTILDGNESFGTVGGLTSVWSADDFDFQVAADCPHDHLIRFGLDVTSDTDAWHSLIEVPVVAPALSVLATAVQDGGNSHLDPGETVGLTATLKNLGGAAASDVVATLFSDTPFITVQDAAGTFGSIAVGGISSNIFDSFTVTASPATYQGYLAALRLALTYSSGVIDTVEFTVRVGTKTSVDPVGPDLYGYYAFDDTDTAYGDAPVYQWVEIDADLGGSGTKVTLGDYGSYQDKSKTVDVPFPFQYYGRLYDRATICSNGWVAMGNTYLTSYRNWTIPGAGGPDAMIAPFWDDLTEANGGEVYQWYDPETRRWIIEWSRMRCDYNGATETFEVIFYDPAYYPTATGDGKIVFQYQTVSISDPVDGYVTVGIENHDQNDGVLYTYFNQYTEGAAPVVANRAIAFVPSDDRAMGTLFGDVLNGSHGNDPLAGAEVLVVEEGRRFFT
ncbi:MAG: hypothetical protein KC729_11770, partial [Candidatus Eisenbacteria bacterium]|nr:hypothetical protein [Candidatus Eisenbacteria bacterium]